MASIVVIMSIFIVCMSAEFSGAAPPETGTWKLVWSDEFDSGSKPQFPDPNNWGYEKGYARNREWQYYTFDLRNAHCKDGFLHIQAHKHEPGTYPKGPHPGQDGSISSASLISRKKVEHQYGWLEMRARIDTRLGSWPAFWSLGVSGGWPDNGECDIMEYYRGMLKFNVAWWETTDQRYQARWDSEIVSISDLPANWSSDFHIWAMEWTPEKVRLYMDGVLYNSWNLSEDANNDTDRSVEGFNQPHYIILNQAIGGTEGDDASNLVYPTSYEIDYVRWYQKKSTPAACCGSD